MLFQGLVDRMEDAFAVPTGLQVREEWDWVGRDVEAGVCAVDDEVVVEVRMTESVYEKDTTEMGSISVLPSVGKVFEGECFRSGLMSWLRDH